MDGRSREAVASYQGFSQQIVVGPGAVDLLPVALRAAKVGAVGVIASPRRWGSPLGRAVEERLADFDVHVWDRVAPHTPLEDARAAGRRWRRSKVDGIVAVGGGSASDLAKAVAVGMATYRAAEVAGGERRAKGTATTAGEGVATALLSLQREFEALIGAPTSLAAIGLRTVDVAAVRDLLALERGLAFNPRPVGPAEIEQVLAAALADSSGTD